MTSTNVYPVGRKSASSVSLVPVETYLECRDTAANKFFRILGLLPLVFMLMVPCLVLDRIFFIGGFDDIGGQQRISFTSLTKAHNALFNSLDVIKCDVSNFVRGWFEIDSVLVECGISLFF